MANPLNVEFPRSMSEAVISWNLPMSQWLNICKFNLAVDVRFFSSWHNVILEALCLTAIRVLTLIGFCLYIQMCSRRLSNLGHFRPLSSLTQPALCCMWVSASSFLPCHYEQSSKDSQHQVFQILWLICYFNVIPSGIKFSHRSRVI